MATNVEARIGTTLLGKLRVDGLLGEGGMGAVYRVHHEVTKHDRALKVLHAEFADDDGVIKRLLREAGVAGTLRSEHVAETFDVGQLDDGSPYVLMELMEGETLGERMERERLPTRTLVGFVCQACEGVAYAHAAGIIHRDLKPDNLFVVKNAEGKERIKLLDFGISKFHVEPLTDGGTKTKEGTVMGTPMYMSPEQALGKEVGPETDIYSLGVILYEGFTGETPHEANTFAELLLKLHTEVPVPLSERVPGIDPALSAVVDKALAIETKDRYPSAQAFLRELVPFAESGRVQHLETLNGVPAMERAVKPPHPMADTMAVGPADEPGASDAEDAEQADELGSDTHAVIEQIVPRGRPWGVWALVGSLALALAGGAAFAFGGEPEDASAGAPIAAEPGGEPTPSTAAELPAGEDTPSTEPAGSAEPPTPETPPTPSATTTPQAAPAISRPARGAPAEERPARERPAREGQAREREDRFEIARDNPYE